MTTYGKYLHSYCLLQRYLYCRNDNKKSLQMHNEMHLKTLYLYVLSNLNSVDNKLLRQLICLHGR